MDGHALPARVARGRGTHHRRPRRYRPAIETSGVADLEVAATIGNSFADQDFSLSDRTSWAVMERLGINEAVSLDREFRIYRFGPDRRRFFTVSP